jgi:predicted nucleic acid-binding protein
MVIVDTTVWIDYLAGVVNPETEWVERELTRQRLGLTDLSLCEVLQGIRNEGEFREVRAELLTFHVHATGGSELAVRAAENYRLLRRKGFTIRKTIDCWIATYCLLSGNQLLHRDRDFYPFEKVLGLEVVKA